MREKNRPRPAIGSGPSGLGDPFAPDNGSQSAMVSHGPYAEQLPVAGMTVGEIRMRYRDRFDIDPQSVAVVDGHPADETTAIQPDQILSFVRRAGEKGSGHVTPSLPAWRRTTRTSISKFNPSTTTEPSR